MSFTRQSINALSSRMEQAEERYGAFASTHEALGVALEEWNELCEAVRKNNVYDAQFECYDLAAVIIRLAQNLESNPKTSERSKP